MRVAVLGDSFMRPDPSFPGRHFSEMLSPWQVISHAQDGSSNAIIAMQMFEALGSEPDAVILGFTMMDRLEFDTLQDGRRHGQHWNTNATISPQVQEVHQTMTLYRATASHDMMFIRSLLIARACFATLEKRCIPFAYTLNGLWQHPQNQRQALQDQLIGDFYHREISVNLSLYPDLKFTTPCYHVDNDEWQSNFALCCQKIIGGQIKESSQ